MSAFDSTLVRDADGQYGTDVDISAPEYVDTDSLGYGYVIWHQFSGTSAAAPHVSGAFALALAAGLSKDSAIARLLNFAQYDTLPFTKDIYYGYGRLNARAVLNKPIVTQIDWCTNGNITSNEFLTSGSCLMAATTLYGAPPVQVRYRVVTSVRHDTTFTPWGLPSQYIPIPPNIGGYPADTAGYTMTVTAYARDSIFRRTGGATAETSFYVCNVGTEYLRARLRAMLRDDDVPPGCDNQLLGRLIRSASTTVPPVFVRSVSGLMRFASVKQSRPDH